MGISAYTRDKLPLDAVCTCGKTICRCFEEFADLIDDEWPYHYEDAWAAADDFRRHSTPEEWNFQVESFREMDGTGSAANLRTDAL